jgi:hypothetical protein
MLADLVFYPQAYLGKCSCLANRALVFLHKPLLDAGHMVTMPTLNLSQLITLYIHKMTILSSVIMHLKLCLELPLNTINLLIYQVWKILTFHHISQMQNPDQHCFKRWNI